MLTLNCIQGSREWVEARLGIPTASQFSRIVTPTGKLSSARDSYLAELLCEWVMGEPVADFQSEWMEWGQAIEGEAFDYFALETDMAVKKVGFIYKDEGRMVGCSPDGMIEDGLDDGVLELKSPMPKTHLLWLARNKLPREHWCQVQGEIWCAGADWGHFMSYHPSLPPLNIRANPDETYQKALDKFIPQFINEIQAGRDRLLELGVQPS